MNNHTHPLKEEYYHFGCKECQREIDQVGEKLKEAYGSLKITPNYAVDLVRSAIKGTN